MYDRDGEVLGYLWNEGNEVKATKDVSFLLEPDFEVKCPPKGHILTRHDGAKFLDQLPIMFSGIGYRADFVNDHVADPTGGLP